MSTVTTGKDEAIAEAEEQFSLLLGRVRAFFTNAAAQIHPDLQPVGYKILSMIVRLGEVNAFTIAEALDTDKSVVSRQVRMLEDAGLVTSRADEKDRRARVLSPTPEAIEKVSAVRAVQQERLRTQLRSRPEVEVRAFASILKALSEG